MSRLLSDADLVTNSLAVGAELERLGLPFRDELSYLEPAEIARNFSLAYQLTNQWWDEEQAETELLGFSLSQAARQEWALPIELGLNARIAYERMFAEKGVQRIHGFFFPPTGMYRTGPAPAFKPANSITQAVLRWLADAAEIPVSDLRTNSDHIPDQRQWRPPLTLEAQGYSAAGANSSADFSRKTANRVALLWTTGIWPQEIFELERGFAGLSDWRLIKISRRVLNLGESSCQQRERAHVEEKLTRAWQKYESSLIDYQGDYPEIFGNPYLRFQFARIFAEMRLAAQGGLSFARLLKAVSPSLIIFGHDAFTIERTLVQIARHKKIPTVGLLHGGLQPLFARVGLVGDVDRVMVWSQQDIKDLTRFDVSADRLRKVGSVRFEKIDQGARLPGASVVTANKVKARRKLDFNVNQSVILLLTSPTNIGPSQATANPTTLRQTWRELVSLAERRSDLTFAIKPHPAYDFIEFYRYLCRTGPKNLVLLEPKSHDLAFRASDAAVLVNYCSTVALDAMLAGVPLVFLRSAIYETELHEDPLEERGAINVSTVGELEHSIDRLLNDVSFKREALDDANLAIRQLLGERIQPALKQLMTELESIAATLNRSSDAATEDLEQVSREVLDEARRLLAAGHTSKIRAELEGLSKNLAATCHKKSELIEDILWSLAFTIGYSIQDPKAIRKVLQICFDATSQELFLSKAVKGGIVIRTYLVATLHSVDLGFWRRARILLCHLLLRTRGRVLRQNLFWSCLAISLVGRNRYAMALVNTADRLRVFGTRLVALAQSPQPERSGFTPTFAEPNYVSSGLKVKPAMIARRLQRDHLDKGSICGVMVTWNPDQQLCSRLETIVPQVDRVVVVDNGSSLVGREIVSKVSGQDDVSLITNSRNQGIARGLNQGIEFARQHGYKWVLTFDQDSAPSDRMVSEQIAVYNDFKSRQEIGVIGAHPKDRITRVTPYAEACVGKCWIEQTVVITSGSLISLDAFEKVGALRDDFFIDGVDHEYCLRLRAHGYRVLVACRAELLHSLGQPASRKFLGREVVPTNHSYVRRYYLTRNRILITREHFYREPRWIAKQLVALIKSTILVALFERDKQIKLKSTALGIWHGIIGRSGQYFSEDLPTN